MPLEAWLWLPLGILSLHVSTFIWKKVRRHQALHLSEFLMAGAAGYAAWSFGSELWSGGFLTQVSVLAFWWCAASPVLSFLWFGRGGRIRSFLGRTSFALLVWSVVTVATASVLDLRMAALTGVGTTAFVFLMPRLWRSIRQSQRHWQHARQDRQRRRQERQSHRREEQALEQARHRAVAAERRLEQSEARVIQLQRRDEKLARQRGALRIETIEQLRQVRAWERQQMLEAKAGMVVHPSSFGFVLLEAARVLRAEIAAGERIPPLENEQFLLEVAERLLAADDFVERYLHGKGERAVVALNRFLKGEVPLATVEVQIGRLGLSSAELAPSPVLGPFLPTLLEAWLIPQQRFQEHQRQRFAAGTHPYQAAISDFLRPHGDGTPEAETWRTFWNASPAIFVHGKQLPQPAPPMHRSLLRSSGTFLGRVRSWISTWRWGRSKAASDSSSSLPANGTPTSTVPASRDQGKPAGSNT